MSSNDLLSMAVGLNDTYAIEIANLKHEITRLKLELTRVQKISLNELGVGLVDMRLISNQSHLLDEGYPEASLHAEAVLRRQLEEETARATRAESLLNWLNQDISYAERATNGPNVLTDWYSKEPRDGFRPDELGYDWPTFTEWMDRIRTGGVWES